MQVLILQKKHTEMDIQKTLSLTWIPAPNHLITVKIMIPPLFSSGHLMSMTPEQLQAWRWEREIDERNRPLTDEELDAMFPEGYKVYILFIL